MTTDYDPNQDPIDPVADAATSMLYGDPEEAAGKLRNAIHFEAARLNQHQAHDARIRAAHAKSMAAVNKFMEENEAFKDPLVQAAGRAAMVEEQYRDLLDAGFLDVKKFTETTGRTPTAQDIFDQHLRARAHNVRGVRSDEDLLAAAAGQIKDKFGISPRIREIEKNRSNAVRERMKASAASHGVDLDKYTTDWAPQSRQPNLVDVGEAATPETIAARDRRDLGEGVTAEQTQRAARTIATLSPACAPPVARRPAILMCGYPGSLTIAAILIVERRSADLQT